MAPGSSQKGTTTLLPLVLGLFLSGCTETLSTPGAGGGGRITIQPQNIDLGVLDQFEEVTSTVVVGNGGEEPLAITRVKSSCNCAVSRFPLRTIRPAQEAELSVTFRSGRMKGRIKRSVQIDSSDPETPRSTIWITADVRKTAIPRIQVLPARWDAGILAPGKPMGGEFRIRNLGDKALEVSEITAFPGCRLEWEGAGKVPQGEELVLRATLVGASERAAGVLGGEIRIRSSDPMSPEVAIPVYAYGEGGIPEVQTDYPLWNFGAIRRGEGTSWPFSVRNTGDGPLRFRFAQSLGDEEGVEVDRARVWTIPPGAEEKVTLRVTKDAPPGVLQSVITFATDDPLRSEIDVGLVGYVGGPQGPGGAAEVPLSRVNRREFRWFLGGPAPTESILDRQLSIRNDLDRPFRLEGYRVLGARCELSAAAVPPGGELIIDGHFFPVERHGVGRWDITLRGWLGDAKQSKTMTIPVVALLPRGSPRAEITSTSWNFGIAETGAGLHHVVRISNGGNRRLKVRAIRNPVPETAGVVMDPPGDFQVEPGQTREVRVALRDPFYQGTVYEQLLISSNDPVRGEVPLLVQGYVRGIPRDGPGGGRRRLRFLYSADELGSIGPCTCEEGQIGGFARAARFVAKEGPETLILHGGDLLGGEGAHFRLRAESTVGMVERVGYQAMALGEGELIFGRDFLERRLLSSSVPLISANVHDAGSGELLTGAPWVPLQRGGLTVGVIGILGPELISEESAGRLGIRVEDPLAALAREVPEIRETCDLVVLLAHTASDRLERLLEARPDVDLVIAGHGDGRTPHPEVIRGIPWVQNCDGGKFMARLDLVLSEEKEILWAEGSEHPLVEALGEDPDVIRLIDDYKERLKGLPPPEVLATDGPRYVGAAACKDCHPDEHARWTGSRHARALHSLEEKRSEYDPECLECHTQGYRRPGGFLHPDSTPEAGGVQCESCHGPASDHLGDPALPYGEVAAPDHCFGCHDAENSAHFEFDEYWPRIEHGRNVK